MSEIAGKVNATGSVFLINPNGVVVAPGGRVVVDGSFTASTRDTSNEQFMSGGPVTLSGSSKGQVINKGAIYSKNGSVTLFGQSVANSGQIQAGNGTVAMVAGDSVILTEKNERDGIFVKTKSRTKGDVTNSGRIEAASAELRSAGGNVYALAGNHEGVISATGVVDGSDGVYLTADEGTVSVSGKVAAHTRGGAGGTIVANGHDVEIGGAATLDARAVDAAKPGGTILVGSSAKGGHQLATKVSLDSGAKILAGESKSAGYVETSARSLTTGAITVRAGVGGEWLTDPDDLTIDSAAATTISSTLNTGTNVTEQTTSATSSGVGVIGTGGTGAININAPISWSSGAALTLSAYGQINFNSGVTVQGAGAVAMTAQGINFNSATLTYATQDSGSLSINGNPFTLIWTPAELEAVAPNGLYALANSVDLSSISNFIPIGNSVASGSPAYTAFNGAFMGLGNYINNLTINDGQYAYVGLFGQVGSQANIQAPRFSNANITATASGTSAGVLAGSSAGTIIGLSASGTVTANGNAGGGLGQNSGNVWYSSAYGTVTTTSYTQAAAGGFAGLNTGALNNVNAIVNVSSPVVSGGLANTDNLGGLVGSNVGYITNALAYGSVTNGQDVGGLVGCNNCNQPSTNGTITSSSASGNVSNASDTFNSDVGGLVGYNSGTVNTSFATGNASITGGNTGSLQYNNAGGLIGFNVGAISNTYAIGSASISGPSTENKAGGLIGATGVSTNGTIYTPVSVSDSFSTGTASAATAGGAFGYSDGTSISNVYYNTDTSGQSVGVSNGVSTGVTGLTTSQMTASLPSGFEPESWGNQNNQTTPYLTKSDPSQSIPQTVYFGSSGSFSATTPVSLIFSANSLYLISANLNGNFALANDIDASAIGLFSAIGGESEFHGTFDGLGHTISNLALNPYLPYVGLFAQNAGSITNVNFNNAAVSGATASNGVGVVSGTNSGTISNVSATGTDVSISVATGFNTSSSATSNDRTQVGGLVGINTGTVKYASAAGTLSVVGNASIISDVGGLAGANSGTISSAYANAAVSTSGAQSGGVGGLVGWNGSSTGIIANAYTTGSVGSTSTAAMSAGGLVGNEWSPQGNVSNVYATGSVSGPSGMSTGALFGNLFSDQSAGPERSTITYENAYYNSALGISPVGDGDSHGTTGTTIATLAGALPAGFSASIWGNQSGETPYLLGIAGNQLGYFGASGTFAATTPVWRVQSTFGLQSINAALAADYVLVSDIDATSVSNFAPIGGTSGYSGILDGQGHAISNLTIDDSTDAYVGLFSQLSATGKVSGLTLDNANISSTLTAANIGVGALVGWNKGEIDSSYVSGTINANDTNTNYSSTTGYGPLVSIGGLAGRNSGSIHDSHASNAISSTTAYDGTNVGGLVGATDGTISQSSATGNVSSQASANVGGLLGYTGSASSTSTSYAAGTVTSAQSGNIGGFVGYSGGTITDSYSTGSVAGAWTPSIGGFVGYNVATDNTISNSYTSSSVTSATTQQAKIGAFAGSDYGTTSNDYFDSTTALSQLATGAGTSTDVTGLTTAQWASGGYNLTDGAWVSGIPYPVLSALPYKIIDVSGTRVYGSSDVSWSNAGSNLDSPVSGYQTLATSTSSVGSYAAWGTGATKAGYQITYAGTNTVTPAHLVITAGNLSSVYGTTPSPSATNYSTSGLVNGDTITSVRITTAATGSVPVGVYPVGAVAVRATMAQGVGLSNYAISYVPGTLTINPASLTITALNQTSVYGTTPNLGTSAVSSVGLVNGDTVSAVTLATAATGASSVGAYGITASGATGTGLSNYTVTYRGGTLTIDPAALTVTALDQSSTYGQTPDLGTSQFSTSGLVNGDTVSAVTLATAATGASNVGAYGITAAGATGAGLGNYTVSYVPGTLTIDPAALTVTALDQSSTYGQTPDLGTSQFSTSGLVNGDSVSAVTLATPATGASNVGHYGITAAGATGTGLSNYAVTYRGGTLTIDPAALTVTALDQASTYGQTPALGNSAFSTVGLVNGDTVSSVALTTAATGASSVGTYGIAASGATGTGLSNYTVTYRGGTLTIDPAALTVTALDQSSTYGQTPDLGTSQFSTSGLVNGDTVSAVTLATPATGASNVGHYGITAAGATGTGLSNYAVT
ncbi:hypothetical protein HLH25_18965, partial [Gluconacetobacter sp. 1a LMG 1728]|nr:hypothetical protein [Gluconacetobacter dulcium]